MIAITMHCFPYLYPGSKYIANAAKHSWRHLHFPPFAYAVGVNTEVSQQVQVQKVVLLLYPEHFGILKNYENS